MMPKKLTTWANLAAEKTVTAAIDTEFQGTETLTMQFTVRLGDEVRVQLYHAPSIPPPPQGCFGKVFTDRFPERVVVRPPKVISPDLFPAMMLTDLLELPPVNHLSRYEGDARRQARHGSGDDRRPSHKTTRLPRIDIVWVGHFLRADLLRAFGRNFYAGLLAPSDRPPVVALRDGKVLGFSGTGGGAADVYSDPPVQYVEDGDQLYELVLHTMDTNCISGPTKLDELARSYMGLAKDTSVTDADMAKMKTVFCDPRRTGDAYRYAAQDAVITLVVAERMKQQHENLYKAIGIPSSAVPTMHGTPGLRVANLMLQHARHTTAAGSVQLGAKTSDGAAGLNKLKEQVRRGSAEAISEPRETRYGKQSGDTHGGLLFSRTPYTFFHRAPGQLRDLDLKSCYPAIIGKTVVYFGRPLVLEPGHPTWTLKRAVEYLRKHADSDSAWIVKASGPIHGFANTLVPSTVDAITNDNYRDRNFSRAARSANVARLGRKNQEWLRERIDDRKYAALYTDEVNAGVVTDAIWLMIQALPPSARQQYENLRAETMIFYPRKLVAGSGEEYDALVAKFKTGRQVDWRQELDLNEMTRTTVEDIDEKHVSLRYPVGVLTQQLIEMRETAGKDTAEGLLYKTMANTVYGAFASPFLPTSNPVAANVITGKARALAYAMMMSLNGLLVITDGVLYRRDQIPADTFAARLRRCGDYPLLHADSGPMVDPETIPDSDAAFTDWYVRHALRYFGVEGKPEYEALFRLHALLHKETPETQGPSFDGVFVDGSANYGKLVLTVAKKWRVVEMKARSFRRKDKKRLKRWLCRVYRRDQFTEPPPSVKSGRLLGVRDALAQTDRATAPLVGARAAIVPLGGELPTWTTYKLIKPSAFVFRTARQRERMMVDWLRLNRMTESGPELLALKRTYKGSLSAVAQKLFELIRSGEERLNKLNIDKLWRPGTVGLSRGNEIRQARESTRSHFIESLVVAPSDSGPLTGLIVNRQALASVRRATDLVH